jgi:hypothetical protein
MITVLLFLTSLLVQAQNLEQVSTGNQNESASEAENALALRERVGIIPGPVGLVEKILNRSQVTRMGQQGSKVATASLAMPVYQSDRLVTEDKAKLHVRFNDETYVELGPLSALGVERMRRGADRESDRKDETVLRFYYGHVRVVATSVEPYVRYYIKNNERVIFVEGPSELFLDTNGKSGDLRIHVARGKVWFMSSVRGVKAPIPEKQSREVRRDNTMKELKPLTKAQWLRLREKSTIRVN